MLDVVINLARNDNQPPVPGSGFFLFTHAKMSEIYFQKINVR